jgi:hypothetical protein
MLVDDVEQAAPERARWSFARVLLFGLEQVDFGVLIAGVDGRPGGA